MSHWATGMKILCAVFVFGLVVGCDRNQEPERAVAYDPVIDAPATTLLVNPDADLLADQATLARKQGAAMSAPESETPAENPTGDEAENPTAGEGDTQPADTDSPAGDDDTGSTDS